MRCLLLSCGGDLLLYYDTFADEATKDVTRFNGCSFGLLVKDVICMSAKFLSVLISIIGYYSFLLAPNFYLGRCSF